MRRRLYLAAIGVLALALAATLGFAVYLGRGPSLEEWTAKLTPPGGRVLHSETRADHHLIAYQAPGSKLRVCVVHPAHLFAKEYNVGGFLEQGVDGTRVQPWKLPRPDEGLEQFDFVIEPEFAGDLQLRLTHFLWPWDSKGHADFNSTRWSIVVPWS